MHSNLQHLSIFTWMDIIESNQKCVTFLEDLELIPKKTDHAPECPKCSGSMKVVQRAGDTLGWRWACIKRTEKGNRCQASVNPLDGTFFQDISIPFIDVIAIMFGYIMKISYRDMKDHLDCWRSRRKEKQITQKAICDIYNHFDEIVFISLKQRGEALENEDKPSREILLKKYKKTLKVKALFRNVIFQLLVDIRSKYPCFKGKKIRKSANLPVLTRPARSAKLAANAYLYINRESSSESDSSSASSQSVASSSSNSIISSDLKSSTVNAENTNPESYKSLNSVPVSIKARTASTDTCEDPKLSVSERSSMDANASSTYVSKGSETQNRATLSDRTRTDNKDSCKKLKSLNAASISTRTANTEVCQSLQSASKVPYKTRARIANISLFEACKILQLKNSVPVSSESSKTPNLPAVSTEEVTDTSKRSIILNTAPFSSNARTANTDKTLNTSNFPSTSTAEEAAFIRNESIKIDSVMTLNNASPSTFAHTTDSSSGESIPTSDSPSTCVIIDSITFHDEISMDTDYIETVKTEGYKD